MNAKMIFFNVVMLICSGLFWWHTSKRESHGNNGNSANDECHDEIRILNDDEAIKIKSLDGKVMLAVLAKNGALQMTQIDESSLWNMFPVVMKFDSTGKLKSEVQKDPGRILYVDEDGDGLPDIKVDNSVVYRIKNIEWRVSLEEDCDLE